MPTTDLTPVERGALLVLMAEARPLKESSELKAVHGIALKGSHRAKLRRLGLINTTENPFIHSLSEKGWQWARHEIFCCGRACFERGQRLRGLARHGNGDVDVVSLQDAA
jgi:hypothetical protein